MGKKLNAYFGFLIKSRKLILGTDNILKSADAFLIVYASTLSENAVDKLKLYARRKKIPIFCSNAPLSGLTGKENVLAAAAGDAELAKAVQGELEKDPLFTGVQ